jgi:hypothetical protein
VGAAVIGVEQERSESVKLALARRSSEEDMIRTADEQVLVGLVGRRVNDALDPVERDISLERERGELAQYLRALSGFGTPTAPDLTHWEGSLAERLEFRAQNLTLRDFGW